MFHVGIAVGGWPGALFRDNDVGDAINQPQRCRRISPTSGADNVVTNTFLLSPFQERLSALTLLVREIKEVSTSKSQPIWNLKHQSNPYLKVGVFDHVFGAHPIQNELGFVGHADDVVFHGVRQEPGNHRGEEKDLHPIESDMRIALC
jgi:hypothetical protein